MDTERKVDRPSLRECPFCGHAATWCDCGMTHCHRIECKGCGVQVDFMSEAAQSAPDFPELYEVCAETWNSRLGDSA